MHARRPTVLVTGFGPFPGIPTNASAELVPRLAMAASARLKGFKVHGAVLPTLWRDGPQQLLDLLDTHQPVLALHFGVSSRTDGFAIEMRCRNECASSVDASGEQPPAACLLQSGPPSLSVTLPVHYIVSRLRRRGLPARISYDPGTYLCNALLYHSLLHATSRGQPVRTGFVHIPDSLVVARGAERRRSRSRTRMTLDQAVEGGLEIIAAAMGRKAPEVDIPAAGMARQARAW